MNLFARIFCKIVEIVLHVRTLLIHGPKVLRDPTWLLVKYQSEAQRAATLALGKELGPFERSENSVQEQPSRGQLMACVDEQRRIKKSRGEKISVAVIIPFRDAWKMTQYCVESLLRQNLENVEMTVCLIDNGSTHEDTRRGLESLQTEWKQKLHDSNAQFPKLHLIRDERPFNFSDLNNAAVETLTRPNAQGSTSPEYLLFLNNDTLWEAPDSLERLLCFATLSPRIGAVGCTLLYRNSSVQHLFLAPGVKLAGAHPAKGCCFNLNHAWYADPRPVPAVTGALLLVATRHFQAVRGFDSTLATSCQDLDFCLKLQELGLENWVLPNVRVKHFETSTRLKKNQSTEITYVSSKWGARLAMNRFYSPVLSRWSERPALSWGESAYPWSAILNL